MSAVKEHQVVLSYVLTLLVVIHVLVIMVINSLMINHTCTDIDECTLNNNGGCEQTCHNTDGSYYCSCLNGYSIDANGHNCIGKLHKTFVI